MQGGEDAFVCVRRRGEVAIRRYYIEVRDLAPTDKNDDKLHDTQWEVTSDGRLSCRFSREKKVTDNLDLDNTWHQLYAWGPASR